MITVEDRIISKQVIQTNKLVLSSGLQINPVLTHPNKCHIQIIFHKSLEDLIQFPLRRR